MNRVVSPTLHPSLPPVLRFDSNHREIQTEFHQH